MNCIYTESNHGVIKNSENMAMDDMKNKKVWMTKIHKLRENITIIITFFKKQQKQEIKLELQLLLFYMFQDRTPGLIEWDIGTSFLFVVLH